MQSIQILFVCTANRCRSPAAEFLARHKFSDKPWCFHSAGMPEAAENLAASQECQQEAARHGLDVDQHRSRQITTEILAQNDLVFCMTQAHLDRLLEKFGANERIRLFSALALQDVPQDLPDPWGFGLPAYQETFRLLLLGLNRLPDYLSLEPLD